MDKNTKGFQFDARYNKPNQYHKEGCDHINISVTSGNSLGRLLDPSYCISIDYPGVGRFRSVLSLIYWLKSTDLDDCIRTLKGGKLSLYAKERKLYNRRIPNYTAIMAYATWLKVKNRPGSIEMIENLPTHLEILSYRTVRSTGIRIATGFAPSIVPIASEIINAVKEGRDVNFDQFVTHPEVSGQCFLEGIIGKHLPEPA